MSDRGAETQVFGVLRVEPSQRLLSYEDKRAKLGVRELNLLTFLLRHRDRVVSYKQHSRGVANLVRTAHRHAGSMAVHGQPTIRTRAIATAVAFILRRRTSVANPTATGKAVVGSAVAIRAIGIARAGSGVAHAH